MMRKMLFALLIAVLLPAAVLAQEEEGLHTKLKMTMQMNFGEEMGEAAGMFGQPMTYNGEMYFAGERVRMNMNIMGMNMVMIIDKATEDMWMLEPMSQQAMHMDLSIYSDPLGAQGGFMTPTGMSIPLEQYKYILGTMDGYDYEEIAPKELLGETCEGIKFTVNLAEALDGIGDEGAEEGSVGGPLGMDFGMSGSMYGKLYFSERYQLPMLMVMQMKEESMGMDMSFGWAVTEANVWTPDEAVFAIPENYEVVEMDAVLDDIEHGGGGELGEGAHGDDQASKQRAPLGG